MSETDILRPAVEMSPAEKLHEEGIALARQRRFDEASELFKKTIALDPERMEARRHLAQAYSDAGRLNDAESAWLEYITKSPDAAPAHRHLGNLRKRMDKLDLAIESLKKAVALDGETPGVHVDLGIALAQAKRHPEAKRKFLRALELQADEYEAHLNLGMLLHEMGDRKAALEYLRKAIDMRPTDPTAQNNLGVVLGEEGKYAEAIQCYEKLLAASPDYVFAWNNLGNSLRSTGREDESLAALRKAVEIKPDYAEAYNNMGIVYAQKEQISKSLEAYGQALILRPDYPEAHANRGLVYLLMGNFAQGWADYEWRWQGGNGNKRRKYPGKVWDGSPLIGRRIVLHYEQGLGDTFQFIRYAKELKRRGARVIFECQQSTREILARTPGIDEFVIRGDKLPEFDFYAPLLGLPGLCQTNLDNLPRRVPYIFTDPALVWEWKQRLDRIEGFRIGIVWQGNPEHKGDRIRSIPLTSFDALAKVPGVTLITLQKNFGVEQIERLDGLFSLVDFKGIGEDADGWMRTAAIIANLDLLVTADTSVGHLAGAMGVPIWMCLPTSPDWRWLLEREDTPWYPTMRLFRQKSPRDWDEVFNRIAEAVRDRLSMTDKTARFPSTDIDQQEAKLLLRKAGEHLSQEELTQALPLLEKAVRLDSANAPAYQDLGVVYAKQGRLRDGLACFRRALELSPDSPGLYSNLGLACFHAGQIEEAVSHLRKAIWLGSSSADTHKNLARALTALPDPAGAEESYWAALRLRPDDVETHYHLARVLLTQGKYEQGWLELEWRWKWRKVNKRHLDKPRWLGQKLEDKRLLVLAEDDTRDTVQFARYADLLAQKGARVALECQPSMEKLMAGCLGIDRVIPMGSQLPQYDFHVALLSLPAILRTTPENLPASRPYLGVEKGALQHWKGRLDELRAVKIGIALDPDPLSPNGENPMALWTSCVHHLVRIEDITILDLGDCGAEAMPASQPSRPIQHPRLLHPTDFGSLPSDLAARWPMLAAIVKNLDLLITNDNTMAHIAGAMGVATWIILPIAPDPRWMLNRDDSPWYPTMRLFRQRYRGDWDEVSSRITEAMRRNLTKDQ